MMPIFYVMQRASGPVKLGGIYRRSFGPTDVAVERRRKEISRSLGGEQVTILYTSLRLDERFEQRRWARHRIGRGDWFKPARELLRAYRR